MATYTIQSGDTLSKIAAKYGTSVAALASANGISDPNKISAGKTITIPAVGTPAKGSATPPANAGAGISTSGQADLYDQKTGFLTQAGIAAGAKPTQPNDPANKTSGASNIPYSSTDASGNVTFNTGNPSLDAALSSLSGFVSTNLAQGNKINPALQITPDLAAKFLAEAHTQIDPEGQQHITNEIEGINASLKNLQAQYENSTAEQQAVFEQNLGTERNNAGANGIAFSGNRGLTENYMLGSQNRSLASLASTAEKNIGDTLRAGGAAVGNNTFGLNGNNSNFNIPSLGVKTSTLEGARGGVGGGGPALSFGYDPNTYKVGSLASDYAGALTSNANQFLSSYLQSAGNNSRTFQDLNGTPTLQ